MIHHAIFTALGSDRPGLVDEVSQFIFERGGNIEDSRMVNLRGQFAMMVLVSAEPAAMKKIGGELVAFAAKSKLHAELAAVDSPRLTSQAAMPYRLSTTAMD